MCMCVLGSGGSGLGIGLARVCNLSWFVLFSLSRLDPEDGFLAQLTVEDVQVVGAHDVHLRGQDGVGQHTESARNKPQRGRKTKHSVGPTQNAARARNRLSGLKHNAQSVQNKTESKHEYNMGRLSRRLARGSNVSPLPRYAHLILDILGQHSGDQLPCAADEGRRVDDEGLAEGGRVVGGE